MDWMPKTKHKCNKALQQELVYVLKKNRLWNIIQISKWQRTVSLSWTLVVVLQTCRVKSRKTWNWPAGCFDKVPRGPGWGNTLPRPAAPGPPGDLWVGRPCPPSGSTGCYQSVSHCGRSGSNLKKAIRCQYKHKSVNGSQYFDKNEEISVFYFRLN